MFLDVENTIGSTVSNEDGSKMYEYMEKAYKSQELIILVISPTVIMSSSFLNTSIGMFLETYGTESFKKTVKIQSSNVQFKRISDYISKYLSTNN